METAMSIPTPRHSYPNRQYWFRQVRADILLNGSKGLGNAEEAASQKNGDVVNIVFECHGTKDRGLKIGNNTLHRYVFRDMIFPDFRTDVRRSD